MLEKYRRHEYKTGTVKLVFFHKIQIKFKYKITKQCCSSFVRKYCENIVKLNIFRHENISKNMSKILLKTKSD